jgi:hypothetical protein
MDEWTGTALGLAVLGNEPKAEKSDEEESVDPEGEDPYTMEHAQHGYGMPGWAQ